MKKLLVCVGLAAVGTSSLHAQFSPGLTAEEMQKPWSVAGTVRGFYDDNYLTVPDGQGKRHSYGVEVAPQASFNHNVDQTSVNLNAVYDLKYFADHKITQQAVTFNANADHRFNEAYDVNASETFIYSQEPTVLASGLVATPLRTSQNNIHNDGAIGGSAELTKTLSLKASYQNNLYAYEQVEGDVTPGTPSYSALLDRIDQTASLEADWKATDQLSALLGYQYENVDYSSPEPISYGGSLTGGNVYSKSRNNDSHFIFAGVDYQISSQLTASLRAGGQYVEYNNAPTHVNETSPYVDASLTWEYLQASTLQVGVKHEHYATDVVGLVNAQGNPVLDSEATAVYASVNQTIFGELTGGLLAQWQHSVFNGGSLDGDSENFYIVGVNLAYRFNPYLSAETGYNWNKLTSGDVSGRDYTRNQVYIGVKGEY
jgi:hypothetical protein